MRLLLLLAVLLLSGFIDSFGIMDSSILVLGIGRVSRRSFARLEGHTKSFGAIVEQSIKAFTGLAFRNRGRTLIGWLKPIILGVVSDRYGNWYKVICVFSFAVYRLYRQNGVKFVVLYLKSCHVLVMQAVGGHYLRNPRQLGVAVGRRGYGLPKIIPRLHRPLIHQGDGITVRAWLTLFSIYRVLEFPGKLKLSTITDPFTGREVIFDQMQEFVMVFWESLVQRLQVSLAEIKARVRENVKFFPILTSNPITSWLGSGMDEKRSFISTSWLSILWSARLLYHPLNREVMGAMREYALRLGLTSYWQRFMVAKDWPNFRRPDVDVSELPLGKLGLKDEPAGKVRVFAMVDPWTQWLMYPLHKAIQFILRGLPEDGTFDQSAPLSRLMKTILISKHRKFKIYSLDLTAATDRLPIDLQVRVLAPILGSAAFSWADLLVKRSYKVRLPSKEVLFLRYGVGQPMGALSSWVMLALTHHFIVQYCWWRVCKRAGRAFRWFSVYALLGDDIAIGDPKVAQEYLNVMKDLGVGIGLAKSLIVRGNTPVVEFAKRFWVRDVDCSAVPPRDSIVARLSTAVATEFMLKHKFSVNAYLALRGMGFRARGKVASNLWSMKSRLRTTLVLLCYPGGPIGKQHVTDWMTMVNTKDVWSKDVVPWAKIWLYLMEVFRKEYVPKLRRVEQKVLQERVARAPFEDFDLDLLSNEPGVVGSWPTGRWHPWAEWFPFLGREVPVPHRGGFSASTGEWELLRQCRWWEGWFPRYSIGYSLEGIRVWHFMDRSGLWRLRQAAPLKEEMIGPFRVPIIYSLLESQEHMEREGHFASAKVIAEAFDKTEEWGYKYLIFAKDRGLPVYWAYLVTHLWGLMRSIDSDAVAPVATWEVQERKEEKSFTSFLPLYHKWVAIQRIIHKSLPVKRKESLALIPCRSVVAKPEMELLPSLVRKTISPLSFIRNGVPTYWDLWAGVGYELRKWFVIGFGFAVLVLVELEYITYYMSKAGRADFNWFEATSEGEPQTCLDRRRLYYDVKDSSNAWWYISAMLVVITVGVIWLSWSGGPPPGDPVDMTAGLLPLELPARVGSESPALIRLDRSVSYLGATASSVQGEPDLVSPLRMHGYWE